jgi:hypothetical protein
MRMPVWHWTVGHDSRALCRDKGLCQFLYPKVGAPWQFAEVDAVCFHAGSAVYGNYNDAGPGHEVERFPDEELTPDQTLWIARTIEWEADEWGVPPVHYWGPRFPAHGANFHGHVNHSDIHPNPDGLSAEEWKLVASPGPAPTEPVGEDDMTVWLCLDEGQWKGAWVQEGDRVIVHRPSVNDVSPGRSVRVDAQTMAAIYAKVASAP